MIGEDGVRSLYEERGYRRIQSPLLDQDVKKDRNHADGIASVDFFVVPTVDFKLLFGLLILRHQRRCLVHVAVTANPTADWIARQISEAFPWDTAPRYLIRDRDGAYGEVFRRRVRAMGSEIVPRHHARPGKTAMLNG